MSDKELSHLDELEAEAFYPELPPFPFMHIDTTWKFKEMIEFRDKVAQKYGIEISVFSFRNTEQAWDLQNQRPEMWNLYNTCINQGESIRVFPLSKWNEKDIWQYTRRGNIDIVPFYFAKKRPVVNRDEIIRRPLGQSVQN